MSETEVSTTSVAKKQHGVNCENAVNTPELAPSDGNSCPDSNARSRVMKEVGFTSTAFIGPAFPPPSSSKAKRDIEDCLDEFYKELEKSDIPDGDAGSRAQTGKESQDALKEKRTEETDLYLKNRQRSRHHWYENEPYQWTRPRPVMKGSSDPNLWRYPRPPDMPPRLPMYHRPPFPDHTKPSEGLHRSNDPSHFTLSSDHSAMMSHHQNELHFPPFSNVSPPNVCPHPPQGYYLDCPEYFLGDGESYARHAHSEHQHEESLQSRQEWSRFDLENEEWERRHYSQPHMDAHRYQPFLVLILMRGLPGSGKSTMARELLSSGPSGIILSTDDYFAQKNDYRYDPYLLGAAHEWNHSRARDALCDGRSPVIIDNTNLEAWEMKPYVKMALEKGYKVDFCEPDTSWKFDPYELEKRNKHGVNREKIAQMMDRFCFPISIDIVMNSQEPLHVLQRPRPEPTSSRRK